MKDNKKICFICCVNDEEMYNESLRYINELDLVDGYELDFIKINNATCITKAYNEAMNKTDAKYKVYLHQDVFIINKNFIKDILQIFTKNESVGMLGVSGAKYMPRNGVWWETNLKFGKVYDNPANTMRLSEFNQPQGDYESVKAIDGLIMITQYDIPWREDLFDGWHFYDVSQSVEFLKNGYEVAIPKQSQPWCIHDCGIVNMKNGYEHYRQVFLNEYKNVPELLFYKFGKGSTIYEDCDFFCLEGISIGSNVRINKGCWIIVPYGNFVGTPKIIIEDGCDIGRRCNIAASGKVTIERKVIMAPNVEIIDYNHEYKNVGISIMDQGISSFSNELVIGEGSWLGINSVVVGNVKIGKGCVIGANTVVNKDIPDFCVAVGNPAKVVKAYDYGSNEWIKVNNNFELEELLKKREDKKIRMI